MLLAASGAFANVECNLGSISKWSGDRFQMGDVVVTNTGNSSALWNINIIFNRDVELTGNWSSVASVSGNVIHVSGNEHNNQLAPGESADFGIKGKGAFSSVRCEVVGTGTTDPIEPEEPDVVEPEEPGPSLPPVADGQKCPMSNIGALMLQNFENFDLGTPTFGEQKDFQKQFCTSLYTFSGFGATDENITVTGTKEYRDQQGREAAGQINDAQDFVRFEITEDNNSLHGKAIKVLYPKGGNTSSHSGIQYPEHIPTSIAYDRDSDSFVGQNSFQEMYVSYWVKFEQDFTWQGGGKLPGMIAERGFRDPDREERVNTRLMWREDGKLEFYIHSPYLKDKTAGKAYEDRIFWDNGRDFNGHAKMTKGQWHHIEYRMKLNDVVNGNVIPNGELEGWLDGKQAAFYNDVTLRGNADFNINTFFFSTFFGGSSGNGSQVWWPTKDVYAYFDQIEVSDHRIGYSHP